MSKVEGVLGLVPEVYFDLIARVVPGVLVIVAISVDADFTGGLPDVGKFGLVLIGLLCAYAVGFVFDVAGDTISDALILLWNATRHLKVRRSLEICRTIDGIDDQRLAPVLTKLMAEKVLVRSLCLLSITALAFPAWPAQTDLWWAKLLSAAVFGILVIRMEYHLRTRMPATVDT